MFSYLIGSLCFLVLEAYYNQLPALRAVDFDDVVQTDHSCLTCPTSSYYPGCSSATAECTLTLSLNLSGIVKLERHVLVKFPGETLGPSSSTLLHSFLFAGRLLRLGSAASRNCFIMLVLRSVGAGVHTLFTPGPAFNMPRSTLSLRSDTPSHHI